MTLLEPPFGTATAISLRADAQGRRAGAPREVAARKIRDDLERYVDTHPHAGRFMGDAGARSQVWFEGCPYFTLPYAGSFDASPRGVTLQARSLIELDDRVSSTSIAFWSAWLSGGRRTDAPARLLGRTVDSGGLDPTEFLPPPAR